MKIVSNERTSDYYKHIQIAALQGAVVGGLVSLGLRTIIRYRSPTYFNKKGGYHRALLYAGPAAFCTMTNMERMSTSYEKNRVQESDESTLTSTQRTWGELLNEYKYPTIVAGWAASMGGSFWLVNRNPFMTKAQKIVQARVYAQGLTVLMLLASVALSVGSNDSEKATKLKRDHSARSWERDLEYVAAANKSSKTE